MIKTVCNKITKDEVEDELILNLGNLNLFVSYQDRVVVPLVSSWYCL